MTYKLLKDGEVVNTIVGSAAFVTGYCEAMGYTFEEVPEVPTPEPEPEQTLDVWDELAAAIREGVNDV